MNTLKAGFGRTNINPPMGIPIVGYYKPRFAKGILDDLEANVLALQNEDVTTLLINLDLCYTDEDVASKFRELINKETGVAVQNIFISSTHTHTGPEVLYKSDNELTLAYTEFLGKRIVDAAIFAMADLKPAKMGYGMGQAQNVAFVRRYVMKDGSVKTNPGVNNPDIVRPIGETDTSVNVLRFDREGADSIVYVNFANHPDVVGGELISGDWPTLLRHEVERCLETVKCIFFNGAQGDVNHVNVHPTGGYLNGTFNDFDDVSRGYDHAKYIARVVLGGILQAYDKVYYIDDCKLSCKTRIVNVPSNKADPSQLPEAHRINDLHNAGKDSELPYKGMMLTTVVAEAARMVKLENAPDNFEMELIGVRVGPVIMVGIPGEPFTGIGLGLKATEGFDMILPCCLTNGSHGYFPMQDSYDEGGYEARSSSFKAGVAELIVKEGKELIKSMI